LALFALAVQLVLSFGHVHLNAVSASTLTALADGTGASLGRPNAPIPKPDGSTAFDCPICALIQLAAAAVPATAPAMPLPANFGPIWPNAPAEAALVTRPYLLFQSRAPPSV
jgi:hypothetical protein